MILVLSANLPCTFHDNVLMAGVNVLKSVLHLHTQVILLVARSHNWQRDDSQPSGQYMCSVSFPESFVVVIKSAETNLVLPCSDLFVFKCPRGLVRQLDFRSQIPYPLGSFPPRITFHMTLPIRSSEVSASPIQVLYTILIDCFTIIRSLERPTDRLSTYVPMPLPG